MYPGQNRLEGHRRGLGGFAGRTDRISVHGSLKRNMNVVNAENGDDALWIGVPIGFDLCRKLITVYGITSHVVQSGVAGRNNQRLIDESDAIFAVLDGTDVDSGTAAEIGYGFAREKPILGYRGDFRLCADNEGGIVNLQVEYFIRASGGDIIGKIDDLPAAIERLVAANRGGRS
jgi:hypothetical protein